MKGMKRLSVDIPENLHRQIFQHITATWPSEPHGKLHKIVVEALEAYMEIDDEMLTKTEKSILKAINSGATNYGSIRSSMGGSLKYSDYESITHNLQKTGLIKLSLNGKKATITSEGSRHLIRGMR